MKPEDVSLCSHGADDFCEECCCAAVLLLCCCCAAAVLLHNNKRKRERRRRKREVSVWGVLPRYIGPPLLMVNGLAMALTNACEASTLTLFVPLPPQGFQSPLFVPPRPQGFNDGRGLGRRPS